MWPTRRGKPGAFEGSHFTTSVGGLQTQCLTRWPGRVPKGWGSNEMVHQDRVIDGIDQRPFFEGRQDASNREGCLVWVRDRLHGVKWRNFKVMFVRQRYLDEEVQTLTMPHVINLITDPKERESYNQQHLHYWVLGHARRLVRVFEATVRGEPLIPAGAPLATVPRAKQSRRTEKTGE
jgi:hypothetical protein